MKPSVYLAGPISGLTFGEASAWREKMKRALHPDIDAFSPLRDKESHLPADEPLSPDAIGDGHPLVAENGLFMRDFFDVQRADLLLVNLLGTKRVTQGTLYEIAWAFQLRKPIVAILEPTGNPHEHPFLRCCASFRTDSLADACGIVRSVLLP